MVGRLSPIEILHLLHILALLVPTTFDSLMDSGEGEGDVTRAAIAGEFVILKFGSENIWCAQRQFRLETEAQISFKGRNRGQAARYKT